MKKLLIMLAVLCLAAPGMAVDWTFYGSIRMSTFYLNVDSENRRPFEEGLTWEQQGNSRIGAIVQVNDQIGGGFEMGARDFNKRKLFGTYRFSNGSELLIGQTYPPTSNYFYSDSVAFGDQNLLGVGQFYTGREPMIQWTMGDFKLALLEPSTFVWTSDPTEVVIPKIEASYQFRSNRWFVDAYGGYNTFDVKGPTQDTDVTSYVLGLGGGLDVGAFYINLGGHWGRNLGNYGVFNAMFLDAYKDVAADKDNDGFGALAVIGFYLSDMVSVEAGYGYVNYELDVDSADGENGQWLYLNTNITITTGFIIVPEVGYVKSDYETAADGSDPNPTVTYFGAKWQINF